MQQSIPRRTRAASASLPTQALLALLMLAAIASVASLTPAAHAQTQTASPQTKTTAPQTQATPPQTQATTPQTQATTPKTQATPTQTQPTPQAQTQTTSTQARTPVQTVSDFYKALRERRFREAFALSIYKPAIEGLSAEEFAELQPEFEKLAGAVPEKIEFGGEQISGDTATVFARVGGENAQLEAITLMRNASGAWIFGDAENEAIVKRDGKEFFLKARIETHHKEVEALLLKLANAEAGYSAQNGGRFAEMGALVASKPALREDVESARTLGYNFQITVGKDGKSYKVSAEPLRYGRTGLLSYYMDQTGMQKKDTGGKPYSPPTKK